MNYSESTEKEKCMRCFVVGDVHGSLRGLKAMLTKLALTAQDELYFIGDLVGKGEDDWGVLEAVYSLPKRQILLGNHDLFFLKKHFHAFREGKLTERQTVLYRFLQKGSLAKWHARSDTLLVHAGIFPGWSLAQILSYAAEVEAALADESIFADYVDKHFFGDESLWASNLMGWSRMRCLINVFTRMRMIREDGHLDFSYMGELSEHAHGVVNDDRGMLTPWFFCREQWPCRQVVFGHWARLNGETRREDCVNIDGGFVYGGALIALECQSRQRTVLTQKDMV